jgi:hypothetical protein
VEVIETDRKRSKAPSRGVIDGVRNRGSNAREDDLTEALTPIRGVGGADYAGDERGVPAAHDGLEELERREPRRLGRLSNGCKVRLMGEVLQDVEGEAPQVRCPFDGPLVPCRRAVGSPNMTYTRGSLSGRTTAQWGFVDTPSSVFTERGGRKGEVSSMGRRVLSHSSP